MNDALRAPHRPWWQPGPFQYSKVEMLVMRALFAALLFSSIKWETAPYKTQRNPTGLAHFFDFTWLSQHPPGFIWQAITVVGLVIYVLGFLPAIGLAPICAFAVMIGTLVTSKAMHHSWQAITLIALAQFIVYAWAARKGGFFRPSIEVHRLATWWSTVVFAAAYVVCGIVKLVNSDFLWIHKVPYLSVQLLKSNWSSYYDTLQPVASWLPKVTQAIVDYPNLARLFFGAGLLVELLGFVVLINRKWAFWGGLAIIGLHLSISKVMDLHFEVHMGLAFIFLVNISGIGRMRRGEP